MDSLHLAMNGGFELYNTENFTLSGLTSPAELSLPNLAVAKVICLNDLPALRSISSQSLTSMNSTVILDTALLSRVDFEVMSAFRPSPDIPKTQVQISNTNLTGLADVFAGAHNISRMSFSNNPSVYQLSLGILHIGELQVHGSGGLSLDFAEPLYYDDSEVSSGGLLNITGLARREFISWPPQHQLGASHGHVHRCKQHDGNECTSDTSLESAGHTRQRKSGEFAWTLFPGSSITMGVFPEKFCMFGAQLVCFPTFVNATVRFCPESEG